ncbi:hypothetical protein HK102_003381, partial [Quaeritorhiza haematococci]
ANTATEMLNLNNIFRRSPSPSRDGPSNSSAPPSDSLSSGPLNPVLTSKVGITVPLESGTGTPEIITKPDGSLIDLKEFLSARLTTDQQQLFMTSTWMYLNRRNECCIDLEHAMQWMGVVKKHEQKAKLERRFKAGIHYQITLPVDRKQTGRGGHNKETILLTPDTFKDLCMLADTAEGSEVREYFRTMEDIVKDYLLMQAAFDKQQNQLQLEQQTHLLEQQAAETRALQLQLRAKDDELQKYVNKTYEEIETTGFVYLIKTDGGFKVGRTKTIEQRLGELQTSNANDVEVLLKFPTSDPVLLEHVVHKVLDPYRRRSKREYFDCDPGYIATTIELTGKFLDTMKSSYPCITRPEIMEHLGEKFDFVFQLEAPSPEPVPQTTQASNPFAKWLDGGEDDNRTPNGSVFIEEAPGAFESVSDLKKEFESYCRSQTPGKTKTPSWEKIYSDALLKRGFRIKRDVNMCKSCNKPAKAGCCEEYSPENRSKRHIVHNIRIVRKTNEVSGL